MQANCLLKRKDSVAWRTVEGTMFLVNPLTKKIYPLNEVGKVIWDSLGEKKDCVSLIEIVCDEFDVDSETAKKDIPEFLEQLSNDGLIEKIDYDGNI